MQEHRHDADSIRTSDREITATLYINGPQGVTSVALYNFIF